MKRLFAILLALSMMLFTVPAMADFGGADVLMEGETYHLTLTDISVKDGKLTLLIEGYGDTMHMDSNGPMIAGMPQARYGTEVAFISNVKINVGGPYTFTIDRDEMPDTVWLTSFDDNVDPVLLWSADQNAASAEEDEPEENAAEEEPAETPDDTDEAGLDWLEFTLGDRETIDETRTYPFVCSRIEDCTSLTFNYSINGSEAPGRWVAYCKDTKGDNKWHKVKEFTVEDCNGSSVIDFAKPRTFDRLAIFKVSRYAFSYSFNSVSITDVVCGSAPAAAAAEPAETAAETAVKDVPEKVFALNEYTEVDDLPINPDDIDQLIADWLAYPEYIDDFHAVEPEVTIKAGERTKMLLFRSGSYNGASYSWSWYGGGTVSLDWAGDGVGWAGHNHVGYFTATEPCTIFVCATDKDNQTAHMVIHAE